MWTINYHDQAEFEKLKKERDKLHGFLVELCHKAEEFSPFFISGDIKEWWTQMKEEQARQKRLEEERKKAEIQRLKNQYQKELAGLQKRMTYIQEQLIEIECNGKS